jgi:hypothetical protein
MPDETRGLLGRLPRPEGQPALELRSLPFVPALPAYPPELHNIEKALEPSLLGNDVWGDCVFVSIEMNRRIAAAALGIAVTHLTAAEVVAKYKAFTGTTTPPGPGAVILNALNWVRKNPAGWGGNHLLFYADVPHSEDALRHACFEFQSVITGELIRAAQEYPARKWIHTLTAVLGGHATPGGTYTALLDFLRTWGYIVEVDPSFFAADIDEIVVCVWDFMWETLSYERQVQLIADLQTLTGKPWNGPAPVMPYTPRTAMSSHFFTPTRVLDTRTANKPLLPGEDRVVQIAGVGPIPANAVGIAGNLTFASPTAVGFVAVTPTRYVGPSSTVNFGRGQAPDPNGFDCGLSDGTLSLHNDSKGTVHVVLDVTRADVP